MANAVTGFYQTLTTGVTEANKLLAPTHNAIRSVYTNYKAQETALGQTLNVPIPADPSASVADIGVGDPTLTDITFTTKPIVFNKHPEFGYLIRDFEQFNSPADMRAAF